MTVQAARNGKRRRAAALAAVACGSLPVREALRESWDGLGTCPVHRVLEAAPGLGPEGTRKVLERAGVWPLIGMVDLTKSQRRAILEHLPKRIA